MDVEKFYEDVKSSKYVSQGTNFITGYVDRDKKLYVNSERTYHRMVLNKPCKVCGCSNEKELVITFFSPQKLTIFEADLLWAIYVLGKRPADYAGYHKCVAGKRFIENIKNVEVRKQ